MEAFQLRLWDGRIGRWLSPDPYGQYASPYLGMGNNPISGIDPDGGWETKFSAWWHSVWNGGTVFQSEKNGDWGVRTVTGNGSSISDGINISTTFGGQRYNTYDSWDKEIIAGGINNYAHLRTSGEWSRYSMDDKLTVARMSQFRGAMNEGAIEPFRDNMKALYSTGLYGSGLGTGHVGAFREAVDLKNAVNLGAAGYRGIASQAHEVKIAGLLKYLQKNVASGKWLKIYEAAEIDGVQYEVHYFKHVKSGIYFDSKIKVSGGGWSKNFTKGINKIN